MDAGRGAGEVFVDDEDEFAEHRATYGYPADVVASCAAHLRRAVAAVRAGLPPYDGTHQPWPNRLTRLPALA